MGYLYSLSEFQPNVAIKMGARPTKSGKTLRVPFGENRRVHTSPEIGPQSCVPNVCRLGKTRLKSAALRTSKDRRKKLIQRILTQEGHPRATSAKDGKNGFVISRSPVRSRRVAPSI
jgi:hypothetical protein